MAVKRGVIVAKIKPGCADKVAAIFAESDASDLPKLVGVRHRSLFILEDIYVHYVETDADFDASVAELKATYGQAWPGLLFQAAEVHRAHHDVRDIQRCALLSIKTGGCPEDCGYCSQSARYPTPVQATPLLTVEEVEQRAVQAREL